MKKSVLLIALVFGAIILSMSFISAELLLSQPKALYSIGDTFDLSIVKSANSDSSGYLVVDLNCQNSVELHKQSLSVNSGQQKETLVSIDLTKEMINDANGNCKVEVSHDGESAETQSFVISNKVNVYLEANGLYFEPGRDVIISGQATKENGAGLEGYVEASIKELNLSISRTVSGGHFIFNFSVPMTIKSGTYVLTAKAYDKSGNEIGNSGETTLNVVINQIPERGDVILSSQTINPGEDVSYTPELYDYAGDKVVEDIALVVYNPSDVAVLKKVVKSGDFQTLNTVYETTPGYWKIEITYDDIVARKLFYVNTLEKAEFSVVNGTLIVMNKGNVPYSKPTEITIGDKTEILNNLDINVGEEKVIGLDVSKNGEYQIAVNDGSGSQSLGTTMLTGRVVDFEDVYKGKYSIAFWIIIVLILGGIFYYFYKNVRKEDYVSSKPSSSSIAKGPIRLFSAAADKEDKKGMLKESGQRGESVVVALKVKRSLGEEGNAKDSVRVALQKAISAGAKVYAEGDYKTAIFNEMTTKERDNQLKAVKVANEMANVLNEHNKKYGEKIDFGIGVNSGEMIGEHVTGGIKFTPIGNTLIVAKRIAEKADNIALLSAGVHRRVIGAVKCEKIHGAEYWKITNIVNRSQHSGFIDGFMKRQEDKKNDFWKK